jgi:peptidyl-prolyl cis-trans isomerase C
MKNTAAGLSHRFLPCAGLLLLGVLIGLWGCQKKAPSAAETGKPAETPAPSTPTPPAEDKVVATVNGLNIMESQVQRRIDVRWKPTLAKLAAQSPELAGQQERLLRQSVTNDLVIEALLDEQAKQAGVQVTPDELTAEMTKQLAGQNPPMTVEQYQKIVEAQGGDFGAMKGFLAQNMKYHKLLESKLAGTVTATEEEARKYYSENAQEFQTPEQVRASHILLSTKPADPNQTAEQAKAAAKKKAEELLQKVKDGTDFAALAKENSSCPSKEQGGDLGMFARGQMVKPFEDVAFALKPGAISDLVETEFGYHIIKVTEHRDPNQVTFEQAKAGIVEQLTQQKRNTATRQYIESLREKATIVMPSSTPPVPAPAVQPPVAQPPAAAPAAPPASAPSATPPTPPATTPPAPAGPTDTSEKK